MGMAKDRKTWYEMIIINCSLGRYQEAEKIKSRMNHTLTIDHFFDNTFHCGNLPAFVISSVDVLQVKMWARQKCKLLLPLYGEINWKYLQKLL